MKKIERFFSDGQELTVSRRIGKGGEGEVFSLSNVPGFAVKAYLPAFLKKREPKIRAMVAAKIGSTTATVAFPLRVVVNSAGEFAGFIMKLVEKHKEIHELQTPASRQVHFPKADYRFLVRTAVNIARIFAQVHASGCVVGDINQRSILVSPEATVVLIDADSFQFSHGNSLYPCEVGVLEYTPPELQGKSLGSVRRTPDHDGFGLAVALFQLLCMDRHPFSGRYRGSGDMPIEKAIHEFRFAYSARSTGMDSPPGSVSLSDFSAGVRDCFEEAFSPQHLGRRPAPSRWVTALEEMEASLRPCSRNRLHHYARAANECPWCRMEKEFGRPIFTNSDIPAVHLPKGRVDEKLGLVLDVQALLVALHAVAIPNAISVAIPAPPTPQTPSQKAIDSRRRQWTLPLQRIVGGAAMLAAGVMYLGFQLPFLLAAGVGAIGIWLFRREGDFGAAAVSEHQTIAAQLKKRVQELQSSSPIERVLSKKAEALDAVDEYKQLSAKYAAVESDFASVRMRAQMEAFLSSHPLRGAKIPKLSSADIASLASYGFATAFDAKRRDVTIVHGIGPVKKSSVDAWVKRLEARFHFRKEYTPEDRNSIRRMQADIISKQQGVDDRIKRLLDELQREARAFDAWVKTSDPELLRLAGQLRQLEVDAQYLGHTVTAIDRVPPFPVPPTDRFRKGRASAGPPTTATSAPAARISSSPLCPSCSRSMVRRVARQGRNAGRPFWGCSNFPRCTGTRPI